MPGARPGGPGVRRSLVARVSGLRDRSPAASSGTGPDTDGRGGHTGRRRLLGALAGLTLSILALILVGLRQSELPSRVEIAPLLLAVAALGAAYLLQAVMLVVLLAPRLGKVRLQEMVRVYTVAVSLGYMTPFGGAEALYQVYEFNRRGIPAGVGSAVVVTKGILSLSTLVAGALAGLLILPGAASLAETQTFIVATLFVLVIWAALGLFLRRRSSRRRPVRPVGDGVPGDPRTGPRKFFSDLRSGFALLWRQQPRAVAACAGLMALYWAAMVCIGPLALAAAGWSGEWAPVVVDQLVLWAILPLSPTPGGSGLAELGFSAFVGYHATGGALVGGVLIWRAVTYLLPLVAGVFLLGYDLSGRGRRS